MSVSQNFENNTLYEMDNLAVLRGMNSETVDLIATDPPFNTKRNRASSAGFYVDKWKWGDTGVLPDQWKWNEVHPKWLEEIKDNHLELYHAIDAAKHCQGEDTAAFLCFLSVRLIEMHRILKPTGAIYLHCNEAVSHYIKMCMDAIFGKKNFRNEVVWYKGYRGTPKQIDYQREHETLFFYAKTEKHTWNPVFQPYRDKDMKRYNKIDKDGNKYACIKRKRTNGEVYYGRTYPNPNGKPHGDVIDIPSLASTAAEKTGSPDQKPVALYKQIIEASSNEEDVVLDPFCGCATTIIAAKDLNRYWIGIDRRADARFHIITRLMGVTRKERKRLEELAKDSDWAKDFLDKQTEKYEVHYHTQPPVRTDNGEQKSPELPSVYGAEPETLHTHEEMKKILIDEFGVKCWGCGFEPPGKDRRYLQLDHINPKSSGGSNDIDNRALLCQPCNGMKSNTMTLDALRRKNKREGFVRTSQLIEISLAVKWTRDFMIKARENRPHQRTLDI